MRFWFPSPIQQFSIASFMAWYSLYHSSTHRKFSILTPHWMMQIWSKPIRVTNNDDCNPHTNSTPHWHQTINEQPNTFHNQHNWHKHKKTSQPALLHWALRLQTTYKNSINCFHSYKQPHLCSNTQTLATPCSPMTSTTSVTWHQTLQPAPLSLITDSLKERSITACNNTLNDAITQTTDTLSLSTVLGTPHLNMSASSSNLSAPIPNHNHQPSALLMLPPSAKPDTHHHHCISWLMSTDPIWHQLSKTMWIILLSISPLAPGHFPNKCNILHGPISDSLCPTTSTYLYGFDNNLHYLPIRQHCQPYLFRALSLAYPTPPIHSFRPPWRPGIPPHMKHITT